MSRFVFCGICDTNLGVLFERDAEDDSPDVGFPTARRLLARLASATRGESRGASLGRVVASRVAQADCGRSQTVVA